MSFSYSLLSVSADPKTIKGEEHGFLTGIIYFSPSDLSGLINVCKFASEGCKAVCLNTSGKGNFPNVIKARQRRTELFAKDPELFYKTLRAEIQILSIEAEVKGMKPCFRLNGTSDVDHSDFIRSMPDFVFYDYTKDILKMRRYLKGELPANYHLTFSKSESNQKFVKEVMKAGGNVAVVFSGKELPKSYLGKKVISGDLNDLRFLDKKGVVVGLYAKGKARKDTSGFVVQVGKNELTDKTEKVENTPALVS